MKVLVIGSSHVGALRRAQPAFAERFPGIALSFFGVRGPSFLTGAFDADRVFRPGYGKDRDRTIALEANGADHVSAEGADRLLMVGYRMGFPSILALLEDQDLLEGGRSGRTHVLPRALLAQAIERAVAEEVAAIATALAPVGPATLALAPYPATGISELADRTDIARLATAFRTHPAAEETFALWRAQVARQVAEAGHEILWQPKETVAGPYETRAEHAEGARFIDGGRLAEPDHRHMNADYGLKLLTEYATRLSGAAGGGAETRAAQ